MFYYSFVKNRAAPNSRSLMKYASGAQLALTNEIRERRSTRAYYFNRIFSKLKLSFERQDSDSVLDSVKFRIRIRPNPKIVDSVVQ